MAGGRGGDADDRVLGVVRSTKALSSPSMAPSAQAARRARQMLPSARLTIASLAPAAIPMTVA